MAGSLCRLVGQGLGVHEDTFARPVADQSLEAAYQPRHPVDYLGEGVELHLVLGGSN